MLGLSEVGSEIRANVYQGGSKHALLFAQSIEGVRHLLTTTGRVTDAEVDEALTALRDPAVWVPPPAALVAAWGRRAG